MNKFIILLVLCLAVLTEGKKTKKCTKLAKRFEKCLSQGFVAKRFEGCTSGKGEGLKQKKCLKQEKRLAKKKNNCDYQCKKEEAGQDWTPIFNSTTDKVVIDRTKSLQYVLKFIQHKRPEADKYLYLSTSVYLYDVDGTKIGMTNFIFYVRVDDDDVVTITANNRFYFSGPWYKHPTCYEKMTLSGLGGMDFDMVTEVKAAEMFRFTTPSGETASADMSGCRSYSTWQQMVGEAATAQLSLYATDDELNEYFTTYYKQVQTDVKK